MVRRSLSNPAGTVATVCGAMFDEEEYARDHVVKRNVFGRRWVLRINDRRGGKAGETRRRRWRVAMYAAVSCCIGVAVFFAMFFSIEKSLSDVSPSSSNLTYSLADRPPTTSGTDPPNQTAHAGARDNLIGPQPSASPTKDDAVGVPPPIVPTAATTTTRSPPPTTTTLFPAFLFTTYAPPTTTTFFPAHLLFTRSPPPSRPGLLFSTRAPPWTAATPPLLAWTTRRPRLWMTPPPPTGAPPAYPPPTRRFTTSETPELAEQSGPPPPPPPEEEEAVVQRPAPPPPREEEEVEYEEEEEEDEEPPPSIEEEEEEPEYYYDEDDREEGDVDSEEGVEEEGEEEDSYTTTAISSNTKHQSGKHICIHCHENNEICIKEEENDPPRCLKPIDKKDPTGCGGLCRINEQYCRLLDANLKLYQCMEVKNQLRCPPSKFNCGNMCIPWSKRCDGTFHCSNNKDEEDCECDPETHFRCGKETSCLNNSKRCDGNVDCWDKSDENGCKRNCSEHELPCLNGQCINIQQFCDGSIDCHDQSDEPWGCRK